MALGWREQYARYKDFFLNVVALYRKRPDLRMFLEVILTLTTIIVFLLFALKPTALTIISLVKEIDQKQSLISDLDRKINNLQIARNNFEAEKENIAIIQQAIPDNASPDGVVRQVEGLAGKDAVKIMGATFGEITLVGTQQQKKQSSELKPLPGGANEMSMSASFTGPFTNLSGIIKDIENLRIPVRIDVLGINATDTEAGRVIIAVLSGRVPFSKNER